MLVEETVLDRFVRNQLRQLGGMKIGCLLRLLHGTRKRERNDNIARTDTRREYFRERTHVDHAVLVHRQHLLQTLAAII